MKSHWTRIGTETLYASDAMNMATSQRTVRLSNQYRVPEETTREEIEEIVDSEEIHVELGGEKAEGEVAIKDEEVTNKGP